MNSPAINTIVTAEDEADELAYQTLLGERIQALKDLVGQNIKVTLTNEFGASMTY
jgi:hypothetical protein